MALAICGAFFGFAAAIGWILYYPLETKSQEYVEKQAGEAQVQLEDMFVDLPIKRIQTLYFICPPVLALLGWFMLGTRMPAYQWVAPTVCGVVGILIPRYIIKYLKKKRYEKFHKLLVDSLMLMSSCLRAGLSMLQSFTVVAEEMPSPVNQEFGLMLKEIRMGVSIEDAMIHFRDRMPSDDTNLLVTAILVARETGGDITGIFQRLVETLRERNKIKEKIKTLTFSAKLQGILMGLLPIVFMWFTTKVNPDHMQFFLTDPLGRLCLIGVIVMQIVAFALFAYFGRSPF